MIKSKTVLIISSVDDLHSLAVAKAIESYDGQAVLFDNSEFPLNSKIILHDGMGSLIQNGTNIDLGDVSGVWWRRPEPYRLTNSVHHPKLQEFVRAECSQAFVGSLSAIIPNFINPIGASRQAIYKPLQLSLARSAGLCVPRTLVTNDPDAVRKFSKSVPNCVYKTFTGTDFGFYETRPLTPSDMEELWRIESCPLIVQEHIDGDFDIRVTVVDNNIYAASIHYHKGRHPVDCRVDRVPIENHELPQQVKNGILNLMRRYGLRYGTIDLRRTKEGSYYFFEINPEGQFLWVEIEAELDIANSLALSLLKMQHTSTGP